MTTPEERAIIRILDELGAVEASPAAAARAVERTRAALIGQPGQDFPSRRRMSMFTRIAALALLAVGLAALAGWLFTGGSAAFADLQEQVGKTRTLTLDLVHVEDGREVRQERLFLLAPSVLRAEQPGGEVAITDYQQRRALLLNPPRKEARLIEGLALSLPHVYDMLRNAPKDAVRRLPDEKLDGKRVSCYVVPFGQGAQKQEAKVWADPATGLPVRLEFAGQDEKGRDVRQVARNLVFDAKLDPALFSLTPPDGYRVEKMGQAVLPAAPADKEQSAPVVTPLVGIGPAQFGMKQEQLVAALGQPDAIEGRGTVLSYLSRGYSLTVSPARGLLMITCVSQATFATKVRDFAGTTKQGIKIGSSLQDLEKAYGKPDAVEANGPATRYVRYQGLGLEFTLYDDKVVQFSLRMP